MEPGDKVKLKFGGGHVGMIVAKKFECSYSMEGKPMSGYFTEAELEATDEEPQVPDPMFGFSGAKDD